jgi:hypothetical protein
MNSIEEFRIHFERKSTGSRLWLSVSASSPEQVDKFIKRETEKLHGWECVGITKAV